VAPGRGQGFFAITTEVKDGVPDSARIPNVAAITFGFEGSVGTNQVDPHGRRQATDPEGEARLTVYTV